MDSAKPIDHLMMKQYAPKHVAQSYKYPFLALFGRVTNTILFDIHRNQNRISEKKKTM